MGGSRTTAFGCPRYRSGSLWPLRQVPVEVERHRDVGVADEGAQRLRVDRGGDHQRSKLSNYLDSLPGRMTFSGCGDMTARYRFGRRVAAPAAVYEAAVGWGASHRPKRSRQYEVRKMLLGSRRARSCRKSSQRG